jgi:hypothetical protein
MSKLNTQARQVAQVVCAFMSAAVPLNLVEAFRNARIDLVVDEGRVCCKVVPALARCIMNPAGSQPLPSPEEMEGKGDETEMGFYVEQCCGFWYDLDATSDDE